MSFVKIHGSILDSSIWGESLPTRVVWITMLAMADENGVVEASVGGLARRAVVSVEECRTALDAFLSPDPDSRDGTTGERIEKVPGGWLVLNHVQYRDRRTKNQIQTAERVRRHRERQKAVTSNDVTPRHAVSPSEAEADTEAEQKKTPPTPPWGEVLGRDEYSRLREDPVFGSAWEAWVAHCREAGTKAKVPGKQGAAVLLNRALKAGPRAFAQAVENSIANNWQGVNPSWGGSKAVNGHESVAARAARKYGVQE